MEGAERSLGAFSDTAHAPPVGKAAFARKNTGGQHGASRGRQQLRAVLGEMAPEKPSAARPPACRGRCQLLLLP